MFCVLLIQYVAAQTYERPIDVLLVIDGSGSMNWPDRDPEGLRIQGAKLFVDLCEKGDRIGVIDFSTDAKVVFPLYTIMTYNDKMNLKSKIEEIEAKGEFTDITLALQTASKEMVRARAKAVKAVILLTDGEIDPDPSREIFSPYNEDYLNELYKARGNRKEIIKIKEKYKRIVAPISREILRNEVFPNYKAREIPIFTVAFGRGADVELLKEIADRTITEVGTRNYYFVEKASDLQPVFSEIVEQLKKVREKISEEKVQFVGKEVIHKISIDNFIKEVTFKFIFGRKVTPEDIQIWLEDPTGSIIDRTTVKEGVRHIFEEGYEIYSIFDPYPGTWKVIIKGREDVRLDITISTWGRTELKILTKALKPEYLVGDTIPIVASLQIEGKRITSRDFLGNLKFRAEIENPKYAIEKLVLYDDGQHADSGVGDGIYGNLFTKTAVPGDYIIKVIAEGITTGMKRFNFTRQTEYKVRVVAQKGRERAISPVVRGKIKVKPQILLPVIIVIVLVLLILMLRTRRERPTEEELPPAMEEVPLPIEPTPPTITLKMKEGDTKVVGYRQLKHPSVGERNLIIRRLGETFYISAEEGTLELNDQPVTGEKEIKSGDIIKVGELYFEVQLKPEENKISLLGLTEKSK